MNDKRGTYLQTKFFFGSGCRGGFAIYERGKGDNFKRCLRVEARRTGHEAIALELDPEDMAELVAVLRGSRTLFSKTIKRPGGSPKQVSIHYNPQSKPPNAWVLVAQKGSETLKIGFDSGIAWTVQYLAIAMLKPLYGELSDTCLWQMLSATGRAAPSERQQG